MKELESKNHLALEAAKIIFQHNSEIIFIGGTALNSFYLDYRYSEDLDLGYQKSNQKSSIEKILRSAGYVVKPTSLNFRDTLTLDGTSIKLDIIEHGLKYNGVVETSLGSTLVRTLKIEEFFVEKSISFFTREERAGLIRDAYDLFSIEQKFHIFRSLIKDIRPVIRKNIVSTDLNVNLFKDNLDQAESNMRPYLKKSVDINEVLEFLIKLRGALRG